MRHILTSLVILLFPFGCATRAMAQDEDTQALDISVTQAQTLGHILTQAVAGSDELNILTSRIRQAQEGLGEARASYYPQVTVTERAGRDSAYPSSARPPDDPRGQSEFTNANSSKMEINQMLFDGFKTSAEVDRQKKVLEGLTQRYRTARQQVVKDTLDVYLTAWRQLQALRAGVAMVEDMNRLKNKIDLQAEAGATDQTVKSYVDSRLTGATQELLKTRNAYREALFRLGFMLQEKLEPETFNFSPLMAPKLLELDLYLSIAQTDNPEILEEIANKAASEHELRKTRAGDYPTLSLTSDIQDSNDIGGSVGSQRTGNAMVQLSYKLFDGFSTKHGKARVQNQISESQYRLRRTTRRLQEDLSQAWRKAIATQQEAKLATQEATASLRVKLLRAQDVESGNGDIVRLIEAEEALYTTILRQLDLVQTLTGKRYEMSINSGQLKNLQCVDGGCADLPMEPVSYVSPVDAANEASSPVSATSITTSPTDLVNTADAVSTTSVVSDTETLLPDTTTPPKEPAAETTIAAPPPATPADAQPAIPESDLSTPPSAKTGEPQTPAEAKEEQGDKPQDTYQPEAPPADAAVVPAPPEPTAPSEPQAPATSDEATPATTPEASATSSDTPTLPSEAEPEPTATPPVPPQPDPDAPRDFEAPNP